MPGNPTVELQHWGIESCNDKVMITDQRGIMRFLGTEKATVRNLALCIRDIDILRTSHSDLLTALNLAYESVGSHLIADCKIIDAAITGAEEVNKRWSE